MCREMKKQFSCGCVVNMNTLCTDSVNGVICNVLMTNNESCPLQCKQCCKQSMRMRLTPSTKSATRKYKAFYEARTEIDLTADSNDCDDSERDPQAQRLGKGQKVLHHVEQTHQGQQERKRVEEEARARRRAKCEAMRNAIRKTELRKEEGIVEGLDYFSATNCAARAFEEAHQVNNHNSNSNLELSYYDSPFYEIVAETDEVEVATAQGVELTREGIKEV